MIKLINRQSFQAEFFYYNSHGETPSKRILPLTTAKWNLEMTEDTNFSFPNRISITFKNPEIFSLATSKAKGYRDHFDITVIFSIKMNRLINFTIQARGLQWEDDLASKDLYYYIWYLLYADYNYDPLNLIIKKQTVTYEEDEEYWYMSKSEKPVAPVLTNENYKELGITYKEVEDTLFACEYLNYVAFSNSVGKLDFKWFSVLPMFEDISRYKKFLVNVEEKSTRKDNHWEIAQKLERTAKTYLNNVDPKIFESFGTEYDGGKFTDRGKEVLEKYLTATNQDSNLIQSVYSEYEVNQNKDVDFHMWDFT